jgi:hypothetical protein
LHFFLDACELHYLLQVWSKRNVRFKIQSQKQNMKKSSKRNWSILSLAVAGSLGMMPLASHAQSNIEWTAGSADLTFYYQSDANNSPASPEWHVVYRNKANTVATGNTTPFPTFLGAVGHSADDRIFSSITATVPTLQTAVVNGNSYWITAANGSTIFNSFNNTAATIDFGLRTRLSENRSSTGLDIGGGIQDNQFASLRLTLNTTLSSMPAGANFTLFGWDTNSLDPIVADVRYDTSGVTPLLSYDWSVWGHTHHHLGFSKVGTYHLVFDVEGIGGLYGDSAPTSQFSLTFQVVPEPATASLLVLTLGALALRRMRNGARPAKV